MRISKRYCYVKGVAGIGNRLYTLASAIEYCERTGRLLYVDWSDGTYDKDGVNCFYKYFDLKCCNESRDFLYDKGMTCYPQDYFQIDTVGIHDRYVNKKKKNILSNAVSVLASKGNSAAINLLHYLPPVFVWESKFFRGNSIARGRSLGYSRTEDVVIYVDYNPPYNEETLKKCLQFSADFSNEMDDYITNHSLNDAIGVHIRATDNYTETSIDKLYEKIDRISNTEKIFLATDNAAIEDEFINKYEGRVNVYPKVIPLSGKQGIHRWSKDNADDDIKIKMFKECLADIYILSKVKNLLYQGNSTFSHISRIMNENEKADWTK